jgi:mono/diheme cytochrome c family protein
MADQWIDSFYSVANNLGFPDPIHAILVHMPMGLVVGAFIFGWLAALTRKKRLALTAFDCITLAFLFLFPVIAFGLMDWRHFYRGAWLTPIKVKMALAPLLLLLSFGASFLGFKGKEGTKSALLLYTLCLITAAGLGWFGGRIVYGEKPQETSMNDSVGERIFMTNCNTCHENGGNKIDPRKPLRNSDDLYDYKDFVAQVRHPAKPMPAFAPSQISDPDIRELFKYLEQKYKSSQGPGNASK